MKQIWFTANLSTIAKDIRQKNHNAKVLRENNLQYFINNLTYLYADFLMKAKEIFLDKKPQYLFLLHTSIESNLKDVI